MPEQQRKQVQQLRDSIHLLNLDEAFHAPNATESAQEILGLVRRAVLEQRVLSFTYRIVNLPLMHPKKNPRARETFIPTDSFI